MQIITVHFGTLEVDPTDVLEFRRGPVPFVDLRRYVLLSREDEEPFQWLQSVDLPHLAMVTLPVPVVRPDYHPRLSDEDREWLRLAEAEEPTWLATVAFQDSSAPDESPQLTANLLGPLAFNLAQRRGLQVVQELDVSWARVPVPLHQCAGQR